jgi:hypothetical protein
MRRTPRWLGCWLLLAALLAPESAAQQFQACETIPMPCTFEAPPFAITVVDVETRRPVVDAHALAEWQVHGVGGRLDGPLVALDSVSGNDGILRFPGWGPLVGPVTGIGIGRDPVITLFKSGYRALVINNATPRGTSERTRVRGFHSPTAIFPLTPFRGTIEEWYEELERVWLGQAPPGPDAGGPELYRGYRNRLRRISPERMKFPLDVRRFDAFFWHVDRTLKSFEDLSR